MNNIPNGMISDLDDVQLNSVTKESNDRVLIELDPNLFCDVDDFLRENKYEDAASAIVEEMNNLEKESIPKGTKFNTDAPVKNLENFLQENNLSV